jgi:hypothetical protein
MRESTRIASTKSGTAPTARKPARSAVKTVAKSKRSAATRSAPVDTHSIREMVAAEAYFLAERRGFIAGYELEDWVTAERVVESRLTPRAS